MTARIALFAILLALTGCGPSAPPADDASDLALEPREILGGEIVEGAAEVAGRSLTEDEARAFEPLLAAAQRIRQLRFVRPVPTRVQTQDDIVAFVRAHIERDELEHARVFYVALGLLAPDLDVERMILAVMGEQIVGYYDPEAGVMVVREDVVGELRRGGADARDQSALVLVHEYVHALQDQHLGLREQQEEERSIDGDNAFASLVEGDATLAMIGWIVDAQGHRLSTLTRDPTILANIVRSSPAVAGGAELERAPAIVRAPLLSRYLDGLVFTAHLHGSGGFTWIDDAFRRPPESTEQVLHPERYLNRERPETIALPAFDELTDAGLEVHDEDTLGELEMGVYFALGTSSDREAAAATGWGGDRIRVYRGPNGATSAVWFTTWDDEREAIEAEAAASRVRDHVPEAQRASHLVRRVGRALLILRDVDPALQPAVLDDFDAFAASLPHTPGRIEG
ncbi:hypothetical protein [Sandaracinus amylolyticus]|uniref:hypothetical protein n=1 Tax=Sandaracinus amylolyticus TaxID=927083 RepID=UPI001F313C32|nr:hypothetical protein [Sandaracinus amylolyticus]UJR81085.1 Hypothetical protein I5071_31360 [Sandaracinus amylolyticus]